MKTHSSKTPELVAFAHSDLKCWQVANDECWQSHYWQNKCRDGAHYELCMSTRRWYPRSQTPYISASADPKSKFLYATYFWKNLFAALTLPPIDGRVLELLPGRALNVAVGLQSLGFCGQYDRIELEQGIPSCSTDQFSSVVIHDDLFDVLDEPLDYDLVIGNHIIDDLLLSLHLQSHKKVMRAYVDRSFSVAVWADIAANASVQEYAATLTDLFLRVMRAMDHGHMILRHYPSTFDLRNADIFRIDLLQKIFKLVTWNLGQCLPRDHVRTLRLDSIPVPLGDRYPDSVVMCAPAIQEPIPMPRGLVHTCNKGV